jgi:hypothetical protein
MTGARSDSLFASFERERVLEWIVAAGLLLLTAVYCLPVILSGGAWGFWDWDITEAAIEAARVSVVEYGQVPGWNPYIRGGERLDSHPLLPLASPSFLLILALGTVPGIKVWLVFRQFLALWGGYLLGRRLGLSRIAGITVAIGFGLSTTLAQRIVHGHWNLHAAAYLPLLIWAGLDAVRPGAWRSRVVAAVCLALMFLDGGPYSYTVGGLSLGALLVVAWARERSFSVAGGLALVVALSLSLSAVKLLPVVEVYGGGVRETPYEEGKILDFSHPTFSPTAVEFLYSALLERDQANQPGRFSPYYINVGAYLGVIGVALALLGGGLGGRVGRVALILMLPYLWLALGSAAPVNLWSLLHQLPGFSSMYTPAKFTPLYLLCLAVAMGAGIDGLARLRDTKEVRRFVLPALIIALAADLTLVARPLLTQAFSLLPVRVERGEFHQQMESPYKAFYRSNLLTEHGRRPATASHSLTADFPAVLANHGVLRGYKVFPHRIFAKANEGSTSPGAKHVSPTDGAPPVRTRFSPNEIEFRVDGNREGILVVNQNFDSNWTASAGGKDLLVSEYDGRLAVVLEPGLIQVKLSYYSFTSRLGAIISFTTTLFAFLLAIRRRGQPTPS